MAEGDPESEESEAGGLSEGSMMPKGVNSEKGRRPGGSAPAWATRDARRDDHGPPSSKEAEDGLRVVPIRW